MEAFLRLRPRGYARAAPQNEKRPLQGPLRNTYLLAQSGTKFSSGGVRLKGGVNGR